MPLREERGRKALRKRGGYLSKKCSKSGLHSPCEEIRLALAILLEGIDDGSG